MSSAPAMALNKFHTRASESRHLCVQKQKEKDKRQMEVVGWKGFMDELLNDEEAQTIFHMGINNRRILCFAFFFTLQM